MVVQAEAMVGGVIVAEVVVEVVVATVVDLVVVEEERVEIVALARGAGSEGRSASPL